MGCDAADGRWLKGETRFNNERVRARVMRAWGREMRWKLAGGNGFLFGRWARGVWGPGGVEVGTWRARVGREMKG